MRVKPGHEIDALAGFARVANDRGGSLRPMRFIRSVRGPALQHYAVVRYGVRAPEQQWKTFLHTLGGYAELVKHTLHGDPDRLVVRVNGSWVLCSARSFELLGSREQWFDGLVSEYD